MKKITTLAFFALTSAGLLFTSCSESKTEEGTPEEVTNEVAKDVNEDMMAGQKERDAKHMVDLAGIAMCEVSLSESATKHVVTAKAKAFAQMMIKDHTQMNKDLMALATNEQVTLPSDISDDAKKDIADMAEKKGKDYDEAYIDHAISKHKDAIDHAEKLAENGYNDQIKSFFSGVLPNLKHHLAMAEEAKEAMKK